MNKNETIVVDLYAGPGSGKSTGMAYVFSRLKMAGINCEMAPEYAKDRVWQKDFHVFENQLYVTAKQYSRIERLFGQVDVVITDSPIMMGACYLDGFDYKDEFVALLRKLDSGYRHLPYFINRVKPYNPSGRFQAEGDARQIDYKIIDFLDGQKIPYARVDGNKDGYELIVHAVVGEMAK
jgi:hypothetical protein